MTSFFMAGKKLTSDIFLDIYNSLERREKAEQKLCKAQYVLKSRSRVMTLYINLRNDVIKYVSSNNFKSNSRKLQYNTIFRILKSRENHQSINQSINQ